MKIRNNKTPESDTVPDIYKLKIRSNILYSVLNVKTGKFIVLFIIQQRVEERRIFHDNIIDVYIYIYI